MLRTVLVAALALLALPGSSLAQGSFPNRPLRVLVGFAAGGPSDIIARIIGAKTSEILGQQVVIENKTGASGMIATEALVHAAPDGYTLMTTATSAAANETLSKTMHFSLGKDFTGVALQAQTANILVVHPSLGVKSVADFVALAKSKPGEIFYATAGRGSATHLTAEVFNAAAGIKTMPVHYRGGGDTVKDLISGQVKVMFSSIAPVQQLVRDGKLIGLATTASKRDPAFPDLPTIAELGYPGFDERLWQGLTAPAGTPAEVIKVIETANLKALSTPEVQKALAAQGFSSLTGSAEEFNALYRSERDKYAKVIKALGLDKD